MSGYTLTTAEKIIKAKIDLYNPYPFYSCILMNMKVENVEHEHVPTMGVNQYGDLYWNKKFVDSLSKEDLTFVLCHEVLHVALLTFQREGSRDRGLWNVATDILINNILCEEGLTPIKNCLKPNYKNVFEFKGKNGKKVSIDVSGKTAEQVYDELISNCEVIKYSVSMQGDGSYDGEIGKHLKGDSDGTGKSQNKGKDESSVKANENAWKRKAVEAVTQAKMRGNVSASMERMIENMLEPTIDWRSKLFAYLTKDLPVDYTMRTPSRRSFATGFYFPTIIRENLELIVGVDISGSISGEEYTEFMSEVLGIANSYRQLKMRVIAWAHEVLEEDDIEITNDNQDLLKKYVFKGGGGTTLSSLTEYMEKKDYKTKLLVILTDGYIEENPKLPHGTNVLFVLAKNGTSNIIKNFGDVSSLNDNK